MYPKTRHSLAVAAVVVGLTAIAGIAAIQGWLPEWLSTPEANAPAPTRITGTAPPETLSPGESVVTSPAPAAAPAAAPAVPSKGEPPPAAPPPSAPALQPKADPPPPEPKKARPAPVTPKYSQAPASERAADSARPCVDCGVVIAITHRDDDSRASWEVRVRFDDGGRQVLRFPADPGVRIGERVYLSRGRLYRE